MKLVMFYYDCENFDIYVGNEFSPDPLDMQQKIQDAFGNNTKGTFSRSLVINPGDDLELHISSVQHIKNLLTHNGYVVYNPHIVTII